MFTKILAGSLSLYHRVWQLPLSTVAAALIIFPFLFTYTITTLSSYLSFKSRSKGREPPKIPYAIPILNNVSFFLSMRKFMQYLVFVS